MVQFKFTIAWILAFIIAIIVNFFVYFSPAPNSGLMFIITVGVMVFLVCSCCPIFIIDIALASRKKNKFYEPQQQISNLGEIEIKKRQLELEKERLALEREKLRVQNNQVNLANSEMIHICPYCGEGIEPNAKFCKYCGSGLNWGSEI